MILKPELLKPNHKNGRKALLKTSEKAFRSIFRNMVAYTKILVIRFKIGVFTVSESMSQNPRDNWDWDWSMGSLT